MYLTLQLLSKDCSQNLSFNDFHPQWLSIFIFISHYFRGTGKGTGNQSPYSFQYSQSSHLTSAIILHTGHIIQWSLVFSEGGFPHYYFNLICYFGTDGPQRGFSPPLSFLFQPSRLSSAFQRGLASKWILHLSHPNSNTCGLTCLSVHETQVFMRLLRLPLSDCLNRPCFILIDQTVQRQDPFARRIFWSISRT